MFYEWVAEGAAFGIKAFFAVFTFGLYAVLLLGLLGLMANIVKWMGRDNETRD